MIGGVSRCRNDVFHSKSTDNVAGVVKRSVRSEGGSSAGIGVGKTGARQLCASRANIARVRCKVAEFALQTGGPCVQRAVAKVAVDAAQIQRAYHPIGSQSGYILLVTIHVHYRIRCNRLGVSIREDVYARRSISCGNLESIVNRRIGRGLQARVNREWGRSCEEVILPYIGPYRGNPGAGMGS